jgi:hypothetical protein
MIGIVRGASCVVRRGVLVVGVLSLLGGALQGQVDAPSERRAILVVIDGVRWQEVFRGADCALMTKGQGVEDTLALRSAFCRGTRDSARTALMPFLWGVVAKQGVLLGDRDRGEDAHIGNTMKFSYPGYNEILTGVPDPRIDKNDFGPNPNVTIFETLARSRKFRGEVRAWGTWDVFDAIFNEPRAGFPVRSGWEVPFPGPRDAVEAELDALWATTTRQWSYMPPDAFLQRAVLQSIRKDHPRALYVGFGEPDEWAHARRYDNYLTSLHAADGYLRELWEAVQANGRYKGITSLIVVTDHGRGRTDSTWTDHGREVEGAEEIWVGVLPGGGFGYAPSPLAQVSSPFIQGNVASLYMRLIGFTGWAPNAP